MLKDFRCTRLLIVLYTSIDYEYWKHPKVHNFRNKYGRLLHNTNTNNNNKELSQLSNELYIDCFISSSSLLQIILHCFRYLPHKPLWNKFIIMNTCTSFPNLLYCIQNTLFHWNFVSLFIFFFYDTCVLKLKNNVTPYKNKDKIKGLLGM